MQKWYFYMDWGSGDVLLNPANIDLKVVLERGVLNDYIERKALDASFDLTGTEFDTANTYFNTNGNYESIFKLYENGIKGTGVLQYEGWAQTEGNWDFRRKIVTFNSFRSNDQYTSLIEVINNKFKGEDLVEDPLGGFSVQGQNSNSNKLYNFTWTSPNFSLVAGTPLAVPNLGRCSCVYEYFEFIVWDNVNDTLNGYQISGTQWVQTRSRTLNRKRYNGSVAQLTGGNVAIVFETNGSGLIETYAFSGTTFSLSSSSIMGIVKFPSICWTGARIALVDELQKKIRAISSTGAEGAGLSIGDVTKPKICTLDTGTETIAFIDAAQGNLVAYRYSGGVFSQVGTSLKISGLSNPTIAQEYAANSIVLHDTVAGILRRYAFSGTTWAQTGNTYSIGGGYGSCIGSDGTNILLALTDTFPLNGSIMQSFKGLIDSLLFKNGINGTGVGKYELQATGNGSTVDVEKIVFGAMADISDNWQDIGSENKYKFSLEDVLKYFELFQQYYYIEDGAGVTSHKIKFIQPNLFSTITANDINISSLDAATELNQRVYKPEFKIDSEEIVFNNSNSADFDENIVDYNRNTPIIKSRIWPFTTDLGYLVKIFTGQIIAEINTAGLLVYYRDSTSDPLLAISGTGIVSGSDTKNYKLSQSQIMNDYWNDYRYSLGDTVNNQITINGSVIPPPDTVRDIIEYKEVVFREDDISITQFPSATSSLVWGGGIPKSYIVKLVYDINKRQYTAFSRRLDI